MLTVIQPVLTKFSAEDDELRHLGKVRTDEWCQRKDEWLSMCVSVMARYLRCL